jgi:hypothetical protein
LVGQGIQRSKVLVPQLWSAAHDKRATAANAHDVHVDVADRHGLDRGRHHR